MARIFRVVFYSPLISNIKNTTYTNSRIDDKTLCSHPGAVSFTLKTPDLVAEAGIKYYCDWYHDDQPLPLRTKHGPLVTVPYTMDLNDSVLSLKQHEGADFVTMIKDTFDTLYAEGAESGRVMCIALHPYIMGQPHRIAYLDEALSYILSHDGVWKAKGDEIADWYAEHCTEHYEAQLGKTDR